MSLFARRVQQRAVDEIRKQTNLLVGDLSTFGQLPKDAPAATPTDHDDACQMAVTGRLDESCARCRAVLGMAGP
jgi:hypothetical protein